MVSLDIAGLLHIQITAPTVKYRGSRQLKNPNMTSGGHQEIYSSGALAIDGS